MHDEVKEKKGKFRNFASMVTFLCGLHTELAQAPVMWLATHVRIVDLFLLAGTIEVALDWAIPSELANRCRLRFQNGEVRWKGLRGKL